MKLLSDTAKVIRNLRLDWSWAYRKAYYFYLLEPTRLYSECTVDRSIRLIHGKCICI